MKKEGVFNIMTQIGVEPNEINYKFADKLLREFSMEVIMKMVDIGNKHEFMGSHWKVSDECMNAVSTNIPKDLIEYNKGLF